MCGKSEGVGRSGKLFEGIDDPQLLAELLLTRDDKHDLYNPNDMNDPANQLDPHRRPPDGNGDEFPPAGQNDPPAGGRPPGGTRVDPPASGNPPGGTRVDPPNRGTNNPPTRRDPKTGGQPTRVADLTDTYTGGARQPANAANDQYTGGGDGVHTSGLASTETPRDPVTRGGGLLPPGSLMTRDQTLTYLADRSPGLRNAMGSLAA